MSRALVDRPSGRGLREWGLGWRAGFRRPQQSWSYRWGRDGAQRGREETSDRSGNSSRSRGQEGRGDAGPQSAGSWCPEMSSEASRRAQLPPTPSHRLDPLPQSLSPTHTNTHMFTYTHMLVHRHTSTQAHLLVHSHHSSTP